MTSPKFHKKNGELTTYAFACGYLQTFSQTGQHYYSTDEDAVTMLLDGVWHVKAQLTSNGTTTRYWHSFDTYDEARKVWGLYRRLIRAIVALQQAIPAE